MPVNYEGSQLPVAAETLEALWQATRARCGVADDVVSVRVVSEQEIRQLNTRYRGKDVPTNILTFSYPAASADQAEHDVALCMVVAEREARERGMELREYVALLLVHAFLHVGGMDHERSAKEQATTSQAEVAILEACGFPGAQLLVV